ncbi:MAG: branched-chain amino acid ABC transporter permease [Chloroflexi bacterium]|nr:branched-chain amino acid ABC transporter permease [Chloroflexota bacterium]
MKILRDHAILGAVAVFLIAFPFLIALLDGQSIGAMLAGQSGNSKFYQGLLIEIFILAIFAISYDLLFGITGLLSFGHAMFFSVGAYTAGIALKSLKLPLPETLVLVVFAGVAQALLFSIVLPRVKGITFALVTLGFASVFHIVIMSHELNDWAGGDVGLQNIPKPALLDPANQRLTFYFVALALMLLVYLFYRRFVDSPTGRVCSAIRENEHRAQMLGFNTFYFKLAALIVSGITAALGGALHALYQPIVSPTSASLGYTVNALLIILIGGVGTLSGALVGAAAFRLLQFYLDKLFGESSSFILGVVYVALVLFLPYGIIGTWRAKKLEWRAAWQARWRAWSAARPRGK